MQRWIEIEIWSRSSAQSHSPSIARQLGWRDDPLDDEIDRDANLIVDIERPHRLAPADLGSVPAQWLDLLRPTLQPGERIARQRLRIASVPSSAITYRLGADDDRVVFTGRRMTAPTFSDPTAFARRAARLRAVRWLLLVIAALFTLFSLGRGVFYWSTPTLLSVVAFAAVLASLHGAVTEWTALRRQTHLWLIAAASFLVVTIVLAVIARPHLDHARRMIAAGSFDDADAELRALGSDAPASAWDELHIARLLTLARKKIETRDWSAAADAVVDARRAGAHALDLDPIAQSIHIAAVDAASTANDDATADARLSKRRISEATFVAWERASDQWGTPELIALRTAMARDVAAAEKGLKQRR